MFKVDNSDHVDDEVYAVLPTTRLSLFGLSVGAVER